MHYHEIYFLEAWTWLSQKQSLFLFVSSLSEKKESTRSWMRFEALNYHYFLILSEKYYRTKAPAPAAAALFTAHWPKYLYFPSNLEPTTSKISHYSFSLWCSLFENALLSLKKTYWKALIPLKEKKMLWLCMQANVILANAWMF